MQLLRETERILKVNNAIYPSDDEDIPSPVPPQQQAEHAAELNVMRRLVSLSSKYILLHGIDPTINRTVIACGHTRKLENGSRELEAAARFISQVEAGEHVLGMLREGFPVKLITAMDLQVDSDASRSRWELEKTLKKLSTNGCSRIVMIAQTVNRGGLHIELHLLGETEGCSSQHIAFMMAAILAPPTADRATLDELAALLLPAFAPRDYGTQLF